MTQELRPWEPHYRLARLVRATIGIPFQRAFRLRVLAEDNVPEGGAVLSANHVSNLDPALLWCSSKRPVHFMAKSELFDHWLLGWGLPRLWGFPIKRGEPDRGAITEATRLLTDGELVGIFPEGTRRKDGDGALGEAQSGAAFIAMRADRPIVPMAIAGTDGFRPAGSKFPRFPRVTIRYGEPIHPADFEGARKERVDAITQELMERISSELELARKE